MKSVSILNKITLSKTNPQKETDDEYYSKQEDRANTECKKLIARKKWDSNELSGDSAK